MWKFLLFFLLLKLPFVFLTNETTLQTNQLIENNLKSDARRKEGVTRDSFMLKVFLANENFDTILSPLIRRTITSSNISESCSKSLYLYLNGVRKWKPWAIHMADATGRIPSGLLSGTKISFGSFEQCLRVRANFSSDSMSFKGKFCMVGMQSPLFAPLGTITPEGKSYKETFGYPPEWVSNIFEEQQNLMKSAGLWLGICLPSTCTEQDVVDFFTTATQPWTNITVSDCQTDDPRQWTTPQQVSMYIFLFLACVVILGTSLDLQEATITKKYSLPLKLLLCFSLKKNTKELFEIKEKDRTPLNFLYGIRFLLSIGVIAMHVLILLDRWREMRYTEMFYVIKYTSLIYAYFENGTLFIENFFLMSGLLLGLTLARSIAKTGKIDIMDFILQRYFRMLPLYLFVILLLFFIPILNSGPIWNSTWITETERCEKFWWTSLLFIQNFLPFDDICLINSWFLGSLMQTQIAGLIIMLIAIRNQKAGAFAAFLLTAFSVYQVYTTIVFHKYKMFLQIKNRDFQLTKDFLVSVYLPPFNHIPSLIIGLGLAAVIIFHSGKKFSRRFYTIGWISAIILSQIVIFTTYIENLDTRIVALYYATRNIFWGLCFAWTIFACFNGYGGLFSRFMSLDVFIPLNRLSYGLYIIQPLVQYNRAASSRNRTDIQACTLFYEYFANILMTTILSFVFYITVENPFINIYYLIFKRTSDSLPKDQSIGIIDQTKIDASVKEKFKFS